MAALQYNSTSLASMNNTKTAVRLCTFCNNTTNGYEKWLFAKPQEKGPFFPILSEIRGECTHYDELERALVCVACFHHLLRQWSSFERRCIPVKKREYNLIPEDCVSNFQIRREEDIRREADLKLKEILIREERLKREAEVRLTLYKQREVSIREEAERRLLEGQRQLEEINKVEEEKLKQERAKEEDLKQSLEEQIQEEKQKTEYIRKEAERLLREEKLISAKGPKNYSTLVLIQSPQGRIYDQEGAELNRSSLLIDPNSSLDPNDPELTEMSARTRTMEYDPETGCYRRIVPTDFTEKKLEDVVAAKMKKSEVKVKLKSEEPAWKRPEAKERGSEPDTPMDDLSVETRNVGGVEQPYYSSGGLIRTEYKFTMKEDVQTESTPVVADKNGIFTDDDIQKAGEAIKAKFREDRMKFQQPESEGIVFSEVTKTSFERRRSSGSDKTGEDRTSKSSSLEKRIKDMEERRARLFKRTSGSMESQEDTRVQATKTDVVQDSPELPESVRRNEDTGSPKEEGRKRTRSRGERNKRRLTAEEMNVQKLSESDDVQVSKDPGQTKESEATVKPSWRGTGDDDEQNRPMVGGSNMWSGYLASSGADDITFTVKEPAKKDDSLKRIDDSSKKHEDSAETQPKRESWKRKQEAIDKNEVEVKPEESKPVENPFPSYFAQNETEEIVFTVKDSSKKPSGDETSEPKPREGSLKIDPIRVNQEDTVLIQWEMKNVEKDEPETKINAKEPALIPELVSGDSTDGHKRKPKHDDVTGGEAIKRRRDEVDAVRLARLVDIEAGSPVELEVKIESSPTLKEPMESDQDAIQDTIHPAPILLSQLQDESIEEERRRKRKEMELKKRRIDQNQKRASLRRQGQEDRQASPESPEQSSDPLHTEDLKENRRSLLLMWESYSDGQGPETYTLEQHEPEELGYSIMDVVEAQPQPYEGRPDKVMDESVMIVQEDNEEPRTSVVENDEYHKLNDEEQRWESVGQYQPGKVQSRFHALEKEQPPSAENTTVQKTENRYESDRSWGSEPEPDSTENSYRIEQQTAKSPVEEDQSVFIDCVSSEVQSTPQPLWEKDGGQGMSDSDHEDDRQPHVDVDEVHYLTEEETKWDKWAGQAQPGKLKSSLFKDFKKDQSTPTDSSVKIKKGETSPYEMIKKMQRTESKQKILVPTKLDVQIVEKQTVTKNEPEGPYVGKLDKTTLYEKDSESERKHVEEERKRQEKEEIEREREDERRRLERPNMEPYTQEGDIINDEFEMKVRAQNVRKIDRSMFQQFQHNGDSPPEAKHRPKAEKDQDRILITENTDVLDVHMVEVSPRSDSSSEVSGTDPAREDDIYERKVRDKAVGRLSMDLSPFSKPDLPERELTRVILDRGGTEREDMVVREAPAEESEPQVFEDLVRAKNVNKLDKSRLVFTSDSDNDCQHSSPGLKGDARAFHERDQQRKIEEDESESVRVEEARRRKREQEEREWEESLRKEREQIEQIKQAQDGTLDVNVINDNDVDTNNFQTRNVRKLDISIFSKFQQDDIPVRTTAAKNQVMREVLVEQQTVNEVESTSYEHQYNTDDYEEKRRSVGKLNVDWMSQARDQEAQLAEQRRREKDEERRRKEKEELERLEIEDRIRQDQEQDVFVDEVVESDKPQYVKKLSQDSFSRFQKAETQDQNTRKQRKMPPAFKNKEEKRQERKLARKESRSKLHAEEEEGISFQETFARSQKSPPREPVTTEEEDFVDKPQNVHKIDLSQFTQFQQDTVEVAPRKSPGKDLQRETPPKDSREPAQDYVVSVETHQDVESAPLETLNYVEKGREEAFSYDEKVKNVGKLDVNKIIRLRREEEREHERRKKDLEQQRLLEEKAEMERIRSELKAKRKKIIIVPASSKESDTSSETSGSDRKVTESYQSPREDLEHKLEEMERLQEEAIRNAHEATEDREFISPDKPQNVNKIDLSRFSQFQKKTVQERPRKPLPKRVSQEAPMRDQREATQDYVVPTETQHDVESALPEVPETVDYLDKEREEAYSYEEKIKNVGRLDVNKIIQLRREEEMEQRRRKRELERQRQLEEKAEMECARLELEAQTRLLEKERAKIESEEIERLREEEEERRAALEAAEGQKNISQSDKPQNVSKIDLSQFSQFQQDTVQAVPRKSRGKEAQRETPPKDSRKTSEDYVVSVETHHVVESSPPETLNYVEKGREEAFSYDEKVKNVGKLDVNKINRLRREEEREHERRKKDLEQQRLLEEKAEMERARTDLMAQRREQSQTSSPIESSGSIQSANVEVVQSLVPSDYDLERASSEENPGSEGKGKSVGRLNLDMYSEAFNKEPKEAQRRKRDLERVRAEQEKEEMEKLRLEQLKSNQPHQREQDVGFQDKGDVGYDHGTVNGQERSYRTHEQDGRDETYTDLVEHYPDEDKPVPKKLDLSKFSVFQRNGSRDESVLRRTKSERQMRPGSTGDVDLLMWRDDSAIRRRDKQEVRKPRPKSIAGTTVQQSGFVNGDTRNVADKKVYVI